MWMNKALSCRRVSLYPGCARLNPGQNGSRKPLANGAVYDPISHQQHNVQINDDNRLTTVCHRQEA